VYANLNPLLPLFQVIDKSFGFDSAVEEAQRAINAAHVEAGSAENGIGLVKLMGRYSGKCLLSHCTQYDMLLAHCIL
jgi:6-phosphofructokinase